MRKSNEMKGLMNWLIIGLILGISIYLLRNLFNWDRTLTNVILFTITGVIISVFVIRLIVDYFAVKKHISNYMIYLNNNQINDFIDNVKIALAKTKVKSYKDIHRMNLAVGYSYIGEYDQAINELKTVYETTKTNSKTFIFCIINIIYLYILKNDFDMVNKLIKLYEETIAMHEDDAEFGVLINIIFGYVSLEKNNFEIVNERLMKAEVLSNAFDNSTLELTRLKIEFNLKKQDKEQLSSLVKKFQSLKLPVSEKKWIQEVLYDKI